MNALLSALNPQFPAYATVLDKLGWWALRLVCVGLLVFLLLPILVIVPLSFSSSSFLAYPMPGWSLQWYDNLFTSPEWGRAAKNSFIVAPRRHADRHHAGHTGRRGHGARELPRQGPADEPAHRADGGADRGGGRGLLPVLRQAGSG